MRCIDLGQHQRYIGCHSICRGVRRDNMTGSSKRRFNVDCGLFRQRREDQWRIDMAAKRLDRQSSDISRRQSIDDPMRGFTIWLASAAFRSDHLGYSKPWMIFKQLNKALTDSPSCAQNGDIELIIHCVRFLYDGE
jgi:hypothetical protein